MFNKTNNKDKEEAGIFEEELKQFESIMLMIFMLSYLIIIIMGLMGCFSFLDNNSCKTNGDISLFK